MMLKYEASIFCSSSFLKHSWLRLHCLSTFCCGLGNKAWWKQVTLPRAASKEMQGHLLPVQSVHSFPCVSTKPTVCLNKKPLWSWVCAVLACILLATRNPAAGECSHLQTSLFSTWHKDTSLLLCLNLTEETRTMLVRHQAKSESPWSKECTCSWWWRGQIH